MSKTLTEIAEQLKNNKKVQLIYAFNGTGKTRLSREFKQLVAKGDGEEVFDTPAASRHKIIYFSAFTEDLFYWDNDLALDAEPRLRIQPNSFTDWLLAMLRDLGQDGNIARYFQHYTSDKLTPHFS
ncbi:anticodon nuclease, partial [Pseudomonas syringae]|nr:anticodon nuclease [Pseudomonas syringae]